MLLLLQEINFASYANDNTSSATGETPSEVISDIKLGDDRVCDWFYKNAMKAIQGKCYLLSSLDMNTSLESYVIKNAKSGNSLGITIDNKQLLMNISLISMTRPLGKQVHQLQYFHTCH